MKKILLIALLATTITNLYAGRRGKKPDPNMPYVERSRPDERIAFLKTIIEKKDTIKMVSLLGTGININTTAEEAGAMSSYYQTVLIYAIRKGNYATVQCLLQHGADPNMRVRTEWKQGMFSDAVNYEYSMYPLEVAAEEDHLDEMDLLITTGADMNRCTEGLKKIATEKGNMKLMNYVSSKTGASAVEKNTLAVLTTHSYEHDASKVTPEMIDQLVSGGADVDAYAPNGKTALMNVIENDDIRNKMPLIKSLLQHRANPNKTDRQGDGYGGAMKFYTTSPLKAAIATNRVDMVKLLVESGANVNQVDGGNTPLREAKIDEIKEYLIMKGAR